MSYNLLDERDSWLCLFLMFSLQSEASKPVKIIDWQLEKIFVSVFEMYGIVHIVSKFKSYRSRSVRGWP